ncbi:unnamed protein product [Linum trigynum]|uniref:Uncharacterized protein n=1 Tax=Linum trigynum TaxID=586398 RepID=A0AAV2CWD6_9ROSI
MLYFLAPENKLYGPADIDSVICAEIPDPDLDPELYAIVTASMMHGPCGLLRPTNSCMKNGKRSKHYPKEFCDKTTIDDNGFAKYRRAIMVKYSSVEKLSLIIDGLYPIIDIYHYVLELISMLNFATKQG